MICKGLCVLSVERACGGKHDGGVQIRDDARHGAGGGDACLSATIARLKSRQHMRHLRESEGIRSLRKTEQHPCQIREEEEEDPL